MLNKDRLGSSGQEIQDTLLGDVGGWAKGQLSPSTINMMQGAAAERGAAGGFGVDSANANAAYMRALGLTSENLQSKGLAGYGALLADNPSAPLYGAQGGLVTPGLYASTAANQSDLAYKYAALQAAINQANKNRGSGATGSPGITSSTYSPPTPTYTPPTFTPTPIPTSTAQTATPVTPFGYEDTFGGSSAAASGGDQTYQDWTQWYDPFGFGDWSQGYGNQVPANTYYDPSTDTSNYDYGLGDYYYGG